MQYNWHHAFEFQYELDLQCNLHSLEVFGFDNIEGEGQGYEQINVNS